MTELLNTSLICLILYHFLYYRSPNLQIYSLIFCCKNLGVSHTVINYSSILVCACVCVCVYVCMCVRCKNVIDIYINPSLTSTDMSLSHIHIEVKTVQLSKHPFLILFTQRQCEKLLLYIISALHQLLKISYRTIINIPLFLIRFDDYDEQYLPKVRLKGPNSWLFYVLWLSSFWH